MGDKGESDLPADRQRQLDDLFSPTLDQKPAQPAPHAKPWRLTSQFWIAFLGGSLPATVIAYINSRRLGVTPERQRTIIIIGAVALIATTAFIHTVSISELPEGWRDRQITRLGSRVIAVLCYIAFNKLQQDADRIYSYNHGDDYASLWKPGILAIVGLGLLQIVVVAVALLMIGYQPQ